MSKETTTETSRFKKAILLSFERLLVYLLKGLKKHKTKKRKFQNRSVRYEVEKIPPDSLIGKWHFQNSSFNFEKQILLKETNIMGNTYYDNYLTWQGEARERLLLAHPSIGEWLKNNKHIKMITHSIGHHFFQETTFGHVVRIEATSRGIKKCSFVMDFSFYNISNNELIGKGWQRICFFDLRSNKLCPVPRLILDLIEPIEDLSLKKLKSPANI